MCIMCFSALLYWCAGWHCAENTLYKNVVLKSSLMLLSSQVRTLRVSKAARYCKLLRHLLSYKMCLSRVLPRNFITANPKIFNRPYSVVSQGMDVFVYLSCSQYSVLHISIIVFHSQQCKAKERTQHSTSVPSTLNKGGTEWRHVL